MERKISFKNLYLVGVISLGLIGLGVGSTFAMFTASAEINDSISLTSGLNYQDDIVDLVDMTISSNKVETATLNITNNTTKTLNYTSWYKTNDSNLQIGTVVSNNYSVTGTIEPNASAQIIVSIRNRGTGVAKVTVGISASESDIVVSDKATTLPTDPLPPYLNDYITNLYTSNTKSDVTNNSITYHYASSVNLMNDRLGGTTEDLDGGNIRYYGASPSNYIDIGDRTSDNQIILWRIIGVFDHKVRIVRDESIGQYSWDTSASNVNTGLGINEWSQADIMKLLNPGYTANKDLNKDGTKIEVNNSLWWDSQDGNCYKGMNNATSPCDFTSIGLSNSVKSKISSETVYLGGGNSDTIYANQAYIMERGDTVVQNPKDGLPRTTSWIGKVALMYPSDYGYATDLNNCNVTINNYNAAACKDNNWLFTGNVNRFITPYVRYAAVVWGVERGIELNGSVEAYNANVHELFEVLPVLTLKSKVVLESGTGTSTEPFVVD